MIDRGIFFDKVRAKPFGGKLAQSQVDGMNYILDEWERKPLSDDLRHLAYPLATTYHECSGTMQPIEEYGKGSGQPYGVPDKTTGQTYYGRGYVQLTWADNYKKMTQALGLTGDDDLYLHASRALDPKIAADVMFHGMWNGSFRPPNRLDTFFNATDDDAYRARDIINGDRSIVPKWSNGVSIGNLIKDYHQNFLDALHAANVEEEPNPTIGEAIEITIKAPPNVPIIVNGVLLSSIP